MQAFKSFVQGLTVVALACSPLKADDRPVAGEACERIGGSRCAATAGKDLFYCDAGGLWRSAPCPGRQVCASEAGEAACRDPVQECIGQPSGNRFCRGNEVHGCSADWVTSSLLTVCGGETPGCARGVCTPCQPGTRRCGPAVPQTCSDDGVWLDEDPCAAPTPNCVFGRCEGGDTFGTECRTADDAPLQVQWGASSDALPSYQVRSIGGVRSAPGWTLHQRPAAGHPDNKLEPNAVFRDDQIFVPWVPRPLIPSANEGLGAPDAPLSILTCPDGTCVASPVSRQCKTVYAMPEKSETPRSRRVAVVGDMLLRENQTCQSPSAPNVECAATLEEVLHGQGYATWLSYHEAQGSSYAWLNVVREQATTRPDVLVLAVATHDALWLASLPQVDRQTQLDLMKRRVQAAIAAVRLENANAKVVIVTASERGSPDYMDASKRLNEMLWKLKDEAPHQGIVLVARWQTVVTQHCGIEWADPSGPACEFFEPDQLHLRGIGDDHRNRFIGMTLYFAFNPLPAAQNEAE